MDLSAPGHAQPTSDPVRVGRQRLAAARPASGLPDNVRELTTALVGRHPGGVPPAAAWSATPVPSRQYLLPPTVRRAPRLWSILYDGLSPSDQRWVLDAIARYGRT